MNELNAAKDLIAERLADLITDFRDYDLALGENQEAVRELSVKIDVRLESLKSAKNTAVLASARRV